MTYCAMDTALTKNLFFVEKGHTVAISLYGLLGVQPLHLCGEVTPPHNEPHRTNTVSGNAIKIYR